MHCILFYSYLCLFLACRWWPVIGLLIDAHVQLFYCWWQHRSITEFPGVRRWWTETIFFVFVFFFFAMQWCMDRQAKFQCLNNYLTLLMLAEFFNRMVGRRSEIQPDRAVASKNCSLYNRTGRTLILMEMNKRCRSKGPRTPLEQSQKYGINHGRGARTQPSRCFKLQPPFNHWSSIGRLITAPN